MKTTPFWMVFIIRAEMLIKKILETLPLASAPKPHGRVEYAAGAAVHELPQCGKVLAVDVYDRKGELLYRFFSDSKNYITWVERPFGSITKCGWTKRLPTEGPYYSYEEIEASAETLTMVRESLHTADGWYSGSSSLAHCIGNFIGNLNWEKRRKAHERKEAMMQAHFAMFPEYPADLASFCEKQVFAESVLYVSKLEKGKRKAVCRHCGKSFKVGRDVKPGGSGICPKCGIAVKYRSQWAKSEVVHKAKICVAHKVEGHLLLRYVDVKRILHSDQKKPEYHFSDYFKTLFLINKGKPVEYAYYWGQAPYQGYDWRRLPNGSPCFGDTYVYTGNLQEVFGEKYYNVDLQAALTSLRRPISFRQLLKNLKNIPQTEYLMKAGLPVLASSVLPDCKARSLPELTGLGKQYLSAMRESQASFQEIRVVGGQKNASQEDLRLLCALRLDRESLRLLEAISHYNTLARTLTYVQAQCQQAPWQLRRRKMPYFLALYRDYLSMAEQLSSDMSKRAILEPRDLKERHDRLVARVNEVWVERKNTRMQKIIEDGLYWWAHEYANEDFCVVYPQTRSDFITEGQRLNHCVGSAGYYERHMQGRRMVFFIRRASEPDKAYFTAEIDVATGRILQLYGFGDCSAPTAVRTFTEGFARAAVRWQSSESRRIAVA